MAILLSGLVGALAVFFLGWVREWWQDERERRGLLRLLLAELKHNEIVIKAIRDSGASLPTSPHLDALKTETWNESREMAAVLPPELLTALVSYYEPLEIFRTLKNLPDPEPDRESRNVLETIEMKLEGLMEPLNRLFGLPTDRRGSYERWTLHAQSHAKTQITNYLEHRFLLAPFFLRVERWREWWKKLRQKISRSRKDDSQSS